MTNRRVKILFVLPSLRGGGAERASLDIIRNLNKDIFEPQLAVFSLKGEFQNSIPGGIKFFDLKKEHARYAIFKLAKLINLEKPDIVLGTIIQARIVLFFAKNLLNYRPCIINQK